MPHSPYASDKQVPEGTAKTRIRRGRLLLEQRFRAKL